jgi:Family of unknown function (DUF6152)
MNSRYRLWGVLVVSFVMAATSTEAHHSFSDIFDVRGVVTLKGTMSKIEWLNPHVYFSLDVKDNNGNVTTWQIECPPTNHLRAAGITRQTLWNNAAQGEVVTVHASKAKNGKPIALLMRVTYADGHFFHVRGDPKEIVASK